LDFALAAGATPEQAAQIDGGGSRMRVAEHLGRDGLLRAEADGDPTPPDLTREPLSLPASRATRLQALARADEGFTLGLAYSTQRGYGRTHAFVGELRIGTVEVSMEIPELGLTVAFAEITVTECETVNQFTGSKSEPPQFTRGYGLTLGACERKAISMSLVDRALQWRELGEDFVGAPAQDEEFVLSHADNIQASGFLEHIKLPHYVDFQAELELIRRLRREAVAFRQEAAE
ncbi:MAG: carbon-phosphorus lyase complex subunit PhnI, partial [Jannaschia sp.]